MTSRQKQMFHFNDDSTDIYLGYATEKKLKMSTTLLEFMKL